MPSLKTLVGITQPWTEAAVRWYGGEMRTVLLFSGTCLWYSSGDKPLPFRWVLVRDADGATAEAFISTNPALDPVHISLNGLFCAGTSK